MASRKTSWTPYAMARSTAHLGAGELTGNIGVQGVHTDVTSSGQAFPTVKDEYWMVLPSLNLNLRTPSDFVIRFAASKEMMRPRLPDLNNVISFGIDTTRTPIDLLGSGGNPHLRPYRGEGVRPQLREVFRQQGLCRAAAVLQAHRYLHRERLNDIFDYTGLPGPGQPGPATPVGILIGNANTHGGYVYGAEVRRHAAVRRVLQRACRASASPAAPAIPRPRSRISTATVRSSRAIRSGSAA